VWAYNYASRLWFLAFMWCGEFMANHIWVQREREKKVNFWVWRTNGLMVFAGGVIGYSVQPKLLWFALGAALWGIGVLIERGRPFVPANDDARVADGVEDVRPGDAFYYKEESISPWLMLTVNILMLVPAALMVWFYTGRPWAGVLAAGAIMAMNVFLHGFYHQSFTASRERITASAGRFTRLTLPMADIRSCSLFEYDPPVPQFNWYDWWHRRDFKFQRLDGMLLYGWSFKSKRSLLVEMSNGEKCLFGINSTETACRLIQSALAARG